MSWPAALGVFGVLAGAGMFLAAWRTDTMALELGRTPSVVVAREKAGEKVDAAQPDVDQREPSFYPPDDQQHGDDLAHIFATAAAMKMTLKSAEYAYQADPDFKIVVRTLDLRVEEDYPRLKRFLADVLKVLPHASLQSVRIERDSDSRRPQAQVALRFALVYSGSDAALGTPGVPGIAQSGAAR